jgi:hypothetical protein
MFRMICIATALALLAACGSPGSQSHASASDAQQQAATSSQREVPTFAQPIEAAHGAETFRRKDGLRFEFALRFGESTELLVEVVMKTDMSRIRMQQADGSKLIWDGKDAYAAPADADWARPRFTVLTWPYFLCAPFKLSDPNTHLEPKGRATLRDTTYSTAKLTFDDGVGDSPDDWYLLYRDDASGLLRAMAYIVTYHQSVEEAEPHAISYHHFTEVDGVQFPTEFRFWSWSEAEGLGKRLGTARLGGFRFIKTDKFTFGIPLSHRKVERDAGK